MAKGVGRVVLQGLLRTQRALAGRVEKLEEQFCSGRAQARVARVPLHLAKEEAVLVQ